MSRETLEWLNTQTLIGFTEKRGNAWHYQRALQGDEPNHYPGAIPVLDVKRRLFDWQAVSEPVYVSDGAIQAYEGQPRSSFIPVPGKQAILTSDTRDVLGIFSEGYQPHQYDEWLLKNVATILDSDLGIGSAGLLRNRAQAWVSVEVPENITTPEGVTFRPNLLAVTSFDGSLATTYKRVVTNVVCDNTMAAGLGENGQQFRLRHTRNSGMRIGDARDALAIVYTIADEFSAEVARLAQWRVSPEQFGQHLDIMIPLTDATGEPVKGRSLTMAEHKREEVLRLYRFDARVEPWAGTALGVLQAYNTYQHHYATVRNSSRVQRNRENAITGGTANLDAEVLRQLDLVTSSVYRTP